MRTIAYYLILSYVGFSLAIINIIACFVVSLKHLTLSPSADASARNSRLLKPMILAAIRFLSFATRRLGVCRFQYQGFEKIPHPEPRIYLANHTGLLDAVMLIPRLPNTVCVFKSKLRRNPFLNHIPQALGFMANDGGHQVIRTMQYHLRNGTSVLIFPEGTRTDKPPLNPFKPGFAVTAISTATPVQTILIHNPSSLTGKHHPLLSPPKNPPHHYRFQVGPEIAPLLGESARKFSQRVEFYFRQNLSPDDNYR